MGKIRGSFRRGGFLGRQLDDVEPELTAAQGSHHQPPPLIARIGLVVNTSDRARPTDPGRTAASIPRALSTECGPPARKTEQRPNDVAKRRIPSHWVRFAKFQSPGMNVRNYRCHYCKRDPIIGTWKFDSAV